MNRTYFKSVRPDGTDFRTGTVHWLPADGEPIPKVGWLMEHPKPGDVGIWDAAFYLSAATVETDCTGFQWPGRLLSVEPVGFMWTPHPDSFPRKRAARAWRVVGELPAWRLFGPQGRQVLDLIEQVRHPSSAQIEGLNAERQAALDAARLAGRYAGLDAAWRSAWNAGRLAGRHAALDAASHAAWDVAWCVAWDTTWDAVIGWLVKDLIPVEDFRALTGPWESVMGPIEVTA